MRSEYDLTRLGDKCWIMPMKMFDVLAGVDNGQTNFQMIKRVIS